MRAIAAALSLVVFAAGCEALFGIQRSDDATTSSASSSSSASATATSSHASSSTSAGGASSTAATTSSSSGGPGGVMNAAGSGGSGATGGAPICSSADVCSASPTALLCSTFDMGAIDNGWDDVEPSTAHLAVALDDKAWCSPNESVEATSTPGSLGGACEGARLVKKIGTSVAKLDLDLDMLPCDPTFMTSSARENFVDVNCAAPMGKNGVIKAFSILDWGMRANQEQGVSMYGYDATQDKGVMTFDGTVNQPQPNAWVHVHVAVVTGSSGSMTLSFDGETVLEKTGVNVTCPMSDEYLTLGFFSCTETAACVVHYDNVVVEVQ